MKILLISLLPTTENFGIKYIHASLLRHGYHSAILFLPRPNPKVIKPLATFIGSLHPDFIGCGFMSYEAPFASYVGGCIKEKFPDIPLLAGGIHPTIDPEACLAYADAVAIGEGEETIIEFAARIEHKGSLKGICNLAFKNNDGTINRNPLRPLIEDLDRLPFPEHFPAHSYIYHKDKILPMTLQLFRNYTRYDGKAYNIISSRGCPFACAYCCNSFLAKLYGTKSIRKRSPHNVIKELRSVLEKFPELILINIHDDCFLSHSKEWQQEFVKDYQKWIKRPFIVRSTPLHVTEEKISTLKDAGLAWVTMGLQSGSERINQKVYYRNVSNEKFLAATALIKQYEISGYYDVILDNPLEAEEDLVATLRILGKIPKPFQLQLFTLTPYQGTDLYLMLQQKMVAKVDFSIRNYFNYRPTFLNKLVRISPLISVKMMNYFIEQRERPAARIMLALLHFLIVLFIEPFSYFYLMLKGFNYNLGLTIRIILPTFKTKIRERIMSFSSTSS